MGILNQYGDRMRPNRLATGKAIVVPRPPIYFSGVAGILVPVVVYLMLWGRLTRNAESPRRVGKETNGAVREPPAGKLGVNGQ